MRKRIGFVAIGQAGGNIGKEFEKLGYKVLYLNTSEEDLNTLSEVKYKYHITGGEGCNKNRSKAKQLVIDDFDKIAAEVDAKLKECDMIFVIFSAGGGTGSGAGPMFAELMTDENYSIGAITVIPSADESVQTQINTYECFSELLTIDKCGSIFALDNENRKKLEINQVFAKAFDRFVTIPDTDKSIEGNVDRAEIFETLKSSGIAMIINEKVKDIAELIERLNRSVYAPLDGQQIIKYITYSSDINFAENELFKVVGKPLDIFKTSNEKDTCIMLSGLGFPKERFEKIKVLVDGSKDTILRNLKATSEAALEDSINFLSSDTVSKNDSNTEKPKSKRSIMNKYLK